MAAKASRNFLKSKDYRQFKPRIGFSYWISLNNKFSATTRKWFQKTLSLSADETNQLSHVLEPSRQLYLEGEPGRANNGDLENIWSEIRSIEKPKNLPKCMILLIARDDALNEVLQEKMNRHNIALVPTFFHNYKNFSEHNLNHFDLSVVNNDFSDLDLKDNLEVTFNPNRPLIPVPQDNSALQSNSAGLGKAVKSQERFKLIHDIEKNLLEKGIIVPLFHVDSIVYYKAEFSFKEWSPIIPEVSFWKVQSSDF